eukprot:2082158-Rhodomonas_salina.1
MSKVMNTAESHYSTFEQELLALLTPHPLATSPPPGFGCGEVASGERMRCEGRMRAGFGGGE